MVTDEAVAHQEVLAALDADDWSVVLQAVSVADNSIRGAIVGDPRGDEIVSRLVGLASHAKWEVRRAVANTAAHVPHSAFETVLAKLVLDQNTLAAQSGQSARRVCREEKVLFPWRPFRIRQRDLDHPLPWTAGTRSPAEPASWYRRYQA